MTKGRGPAHVHLACGTLLLLPLLLVGSPGAAGSTCLVQEDLVVARAAYCTVERDTWPEDGRCGTSASHRAFTRSEARFQTLDIRTLSLEAWGERACEDGVQRERLTLQARALVGTPAETEVRLDWDHVGSTCDTTLGGAGPTGPDVEVSLAAITGQGCPAGPPPDPGWGHLTPTLPTGPPRPVRDA
ncbi:MAG: hypothetical protein R3185_00695 [Candidatus Thermoplasmatota archaeon]|nr:hypothetical protein [Candidatus Thermoplasmatota archaeon]